LPAGEANAIPAKGYARADEMPEPSFCLDGEIMCQFLQALGCDKLSDRMEGAKLICSSRVVRQEFVENRVVLDVVLECECISPDGGNPTPGMIDTDLKFMIDI
jgi:hypothetical protein